jgi:tripartite-type tricarboxylate transporter receptor subunit TctC
MQSRRARGLLCALAGWFLLAGEASAQAPGTYPAKPVRFVVAFPPGGPTDLLARLIGQKLAENLGQAFVIENVVGATGTIAHGQVAKAAPDGYTILMASTSSHIAPYLLKAMPYDPMKDIAPLINVATLPFMLLVHPSVPANNVQELVRLAKSKPGELNHPSPGSGSAGHLVMERFKRAVDINLTHVPFKGAGPGITALVAGQVHVILDTISTAGPHAKAGKLRALAFASSKRSPEFPDVPTMAEAGVKDFEPTIWFGVMAPGATPPPLLERLNAEITKVLNTPELQSRIAATGGAFTPNTPQQYAEFLRADTELWIKVIRETGARVE